MTGNIGDKNYRFGFSAMLDEPLKNDYELPDDLISKYDLLLNEEKTVFTFKLKHGETIELPNMPVGATITIKETDLPYDGYKTTAVAKADYKPIDEDTDLGELNDTIKVAIVETTGVDDNIATFNNYYFGTSTLTITKTVVGVPIDTQKQFLFTVTLLDENGNRLKGTYRFDGAWAGTVTNGYAWFYLRHGQRVRIFDLPIGTTWIVSEQFDPDYFVSRADRTGVVTRGGSTSRWVNNSEDIPLGLGDVYINVGECFE